MQLHRCHADLLVSRSVHCSQRLRHSMVYVCFLCRSEWAVGNEWLGRNTGAMLLATAYILLAGSYLEWCMILRARYEVRCRTL
jgi:hypothetical protein